MKNEYNKNTKNYSSLNKINNQLPIIDLAGHTKNSNLMKENYINYIINKQITNERDRNNNFIYRQIASEKDRIRYNSNAVTNNM